MIEPYYAIRCDLCRKQFEAQFFSSVTGNTAFYPCLELAIKEVQDQGWLVSRNGLEVMCKECRQTAKWKRVEDKIAFEERCFDDPERKSRSTESSQT